MSQRIAIIGGGTGGTMVANRLARLLKPRVASGELEIVVFEPHERHLYQPGLLFVPFGKMRLEQLYRPQARLFRKGVRWVRQRVQRIDAERDTLVLEDGSTYPYELLVIATGARLQPEETEGLLGEGWRERVFDFYSPEGAQALAHRLAAFEGGRLVVDLFDMPIKCPVAPLEFLFLADEYFTHRGIRHEVEIVYVTPLDGAFTKPMASKVLGSMLEDRGIEVVSEFATGEVRGGEGKIVSWDEREVPFDLLVTVPLHGGAPFLQETPGLTDDLGFVMVDPYTLQSKLKPNIFAIGDATNAPASKAGSVAHFEAEILVENLIALLEGRGRLRRFDGHANCFIETGYGKAMLIDFNYEVEPLPGQFPFPGIGPLSLLKETRRNHWGKLAFGWIYWHLLLPGRDVPFVTPEMRLEGKEVPIELRKRLEALHANEDHQEAA